MSFGDRIQTISFIWDIEYIPSEWFKEFTTPDTIEEYVKPVITITSEAAKSIGETAKDLLLEEYNSIIELSRKKTLKH